MSHWKRSTAKMLRHVADWLDPPILDNRTRVNQTRPLEEKLQSMREMSEARNVMQMFEYQAALMAGHHSPHKPPRD